MCYTCNCTHTNIHLHLLYDNGKSDEALINSKDIRYPYLFTVGIYDQRTEHQRMLRIYDLRIKHKKMLICDLRTDIYVRFILSLET
jgi:hypothetical protein